jgi:hypothetical protein
MSSMIVVFIGEMLFFAYIYTKIKIKIEVCGLIHVYTCVCGLVHVYTWVCGLVHVYTCVLGVLVLPLSMMI